MKKAWIRGGVAFVISFLFLFIATEFALHQEEQTLNLFAGAALRKDSVEAHGDSNTSEFALRLKNNSEELAIEGKRFLHDYGYSIKSRSMEGRKVIYLELVLAFLTGVFVFCLTIKDKKNIEKELNSLSDYIRALNHGEDRIVIRDDVFGQLQEELYKTVLTLRESREKALDDRTLLKKNLEDITHQIKTPLTTIQLMLDLIQQDEINKEEYIERLDREINRLNRLTAALLKLSSIDAGAINFKNECFKAKDMIYEAIQPIESLIHHKKVNFQLIGQDFNIIGDRSWLMEAVLNVVKNAVEAVDENGIVEIYISMNDIYQSIMIKDNGHGIKPEDRKHIFERFFKSQNSKKESFGIGLAMAKAIIEGNGGSLDVESINSGSCFEIKLYPKFAASRVKGSI